ncbi:hypothetical protein E1264_33710 [Actinomadura sp. KC216]|uniref:hypothetical protein n=1 Tax=Actinomadura sp. KC216 TaxID=2530370 RepID=UPI001049F427|nr:hypothetical protein [Actinomadura sp. KC216]TDB80747.1 hypothetical protein E1264_33710 [Actinomadura sp. KC216]
MTDLQIVASNELPLQDFTDERIEARLFPVAKFCDAAMGIVRAGVAQRHHVHDRPDKGDEVIFVYGGRFRVRGDFPGSDRVFDVSTEGPVYISVPAGMACSLENLGTEPVRFFSVFSPRFEPGEIRYVEAL